MPQSSPQLRFPLPPTLLHLGPLHSPTPPPHLPHLDVHDHEEHQRGVYRTFLKKYPCILTLHGSPHSSPSPPPLFAWHLYTLPILPPSIPPPLQPSPLPHLEVDDDEEHQHGGQQVGHVGEVLPVERLPEGPHFVHSSDEEVEQGDYCALELGASALVDGRWAEGLPEDGLAGRRGDRRGWRGRRGEGRGGEH